LNINNLSRSKRHAIKSAILTSIVAIILWQYPIEKTFTSISSLSGSTNNLKQKYFSPKNPSNKIVLVGIDNAALNKYGRWPWPRTQQGELLSLLGEADTIALDILYLESDGDDDQFSKNLKQLPQLVGSLASLPNSAHASHLMKEMLSPYMISDIIYAPFESTENKYLLMPELYQLSDLPEKLLPSLARSGLVHINHTENNQQLNYIPGMIDDEQGLVVPSLGLQILQHWYEKNFTIEIGKYNRIFLKDESTPTFILKDYSGIPLNFYKQAVNTISAEKLLSGEISPSVLKDKIVIVGFTAAGLHDTFIIPFSGPIKGVELHTTLVSNFLNDELIQDSPLINLLIYLFFGLVAWSITLIKPNSYSIRFSYILGSFCLILCFDFILFSTFTIWLNTFLIFSFFLIASSMNELIWSVDQEYSSGHLKRAFRSYLSENILNLIRQHPDKVQLGGHLQEASFLFSDIRNFSRLSEELNAAELVDTMNAYFNPMTKSILQHKGMLDKYIGDSVMAIFNAPVTIDNHALETCLCALDMNDKVSQLNIEQRNKGLPELDMGVGINTGEALIGNMGSDIRFSYTAIGDSVNIASRIESITKIYKCDILIGEETWQSVNSHLLSRYVDTVVLKGREQTTPIYQLLAKSNKNKSICIDFNAARTLYSQGKFLEARAAFLKCEETWQDATSLVFAERCLNWLEHGVPSDWKDIYRLTEK